MSRRTRPTLVLAPILAVIASIAVAAGGSPAQGQGGEGDGDGRPTCIEFRGEARYRGYGYHHIVIVENGCDRAARCDVATDVTPESQSVDVPAGQSSETITRTGSPSRAFEPRVSCTLR